MLIANRIEMNVQTLMKAHPREKRRETDSYSMHVVATHSSTQCAARAHHTLIRGTCGPSKIPPPRVPPFNRERQTRHGAP